MKVVGFAGYSGAGKTTLIEQLIARLRQRGLRVSVVKHAHHGFDIDQPGKDTWRHRAAGAREVLVVSARRLALMREFEREGEPTVQELLTELQSDADWVLVEGFKSSALPKLEVWREATGKPVLYPQDPHIVAVLADRHSSLPQPPACPVLALDEPDAVLTWLIDNQQRFEYHPEVPS